MGDSQPYHQPSTHHTQLPPPYRAPLKHEGYPTAPILPPPPGTREYRHLRDPSQENRPTLHHQHSERDSLRQSPRQYGPHASRVDSYSSAAPAPEHSTPVDQSRRPYSNELPTTHFPRRSPPSVARDPSARPPLGDPYLPEHRRTDSMDHHQQHHYAGHGPTLAQHLVESTGPSHAMHMPPAHSPHTDMPMPQPYPPPGHHIPPVHMAYEPQYGPYYGDPSLVGSQQQRRKAVRAAQACDNCRSKKAKCDEARPQCSNCVNNGFDCHYRSLPPPKQDRSLLQITEKMEDLDHVRRQELNGAVDKIIAEIRRLGLPAQAPLTRALSQSIQHDSGSGTDSTPSIYPRPMHPQYYPREQHHTPDHHYRLFEQPDVKHDTGSPAFNMSRSQTLVTPPAPKPDLSKLYEDAYTDMLNGERAIPPTHTTAADKLRSWPSIEIFFEGISETYVRNGESKHHIDLSSYGRNQHWSERGHGRPSTSSPSVVDSSMDDASSASSSSDGRPAAAFVNYGGVEGSRGVLTSPGGRNPNQSLSIDSEEAWRLFDAYFDHIHILQPFLNRKETRRLVQIFVDTYCSEPITEPYPNALARLSHANGIIYKKRKFSGDHVPEEGDNVQRPHGYKKPIQRTVENALVLLMFALGRMCLHQGPLPAPASAPSDAQLSTESITSPHSSTPMARTPLYCLDPSDSRSPRPVAEHSGKAECERWPLNIDRLPGAAYFSHAVSILGEMHGGNTLLHVQASLLAALYLAQLAFVLDSWKWIHTASVAWRMLYKEHDEKPKRLSSPEVLAYWACLLLESDILAELEIVDSGINTYQDIIALGLGDRLEGEEADIREYYLAQISIRKILNRVHSSLYNEKKMKENKSGWSNLTFRELSDQLEEWKEVLPARFKWSEEDKTTANTINGARLRAKYYGARNIIHRHFLKQAIEFDMPWSERLSQVQYSDIFSNARICIDAVHNSTVAFDRVPGMKQRLIVTNIFGTAHAQFGNMLVLGAASLSNAMKAIYPPKETLKQLNRTIDFLSYLAPLSPTMATNIRILENIQIKMRDAMPAESSGRISANTSFVGA